MPCGDIAAGFQRQSGIALKVTYGSSGNLTTQIENGAPFDVFFSADSDYPKQLIQAGAADPASFYQYATGHLVLWVRNGSKLDLRQGMRLLADPAIGKIAIANPAHAPYGRAAVAAMKSAGVYAQAADRLVLGENISQAAQYVQTGAADVGLIAMSLALSPAMSSQGRYVLVPPDSYPPIRQAVVIVARSPHRAEAARFLAYLKEKSSMEILKKFGFAPPSDVAAPKPRTELCCSIMSSSGFFVFRASPGATCF